MFTARKNRKHSFPHFHDLTCSHAQIKKIRISAITEAKCIREQSFTNRGTRTSGVTRTVVWWYVKKFRIFSKIKTLKR